MVKIRMQLIAFNYMYNNNMTRNFNIYKFD